MLRKSKGARRQESIFHTSRLTPYEKEEGREDL